MTPLALTLMISSMGLVTALEIYCIWRLLSPKQGKISGDVPDVDEDAR